MGLAPYGNSRKKVGSSKKRYIDYFREIIKLDPKDPLKYIIDKDWIDYQNVKDKWISDKFIKIFGKKREYNSKITIHHKNIAAALQERLEEIILTQLKILQKKTKQTHLCISGGEEFELISKIKSHYIKICELYCYHFQDKFFVRLKKLFLRSLNFKKVIIKNKGFSVSTKSNFFYIVLISLLIILSFLGSIFFFKFFYILLINIIIFIFIEKKFFIFLTKKRFYNLIFASFFFKIIENVIIMCGVFLSYIKNDKRF